MSYATVSYGKSGPYNTQMHDSAGMAPVLIIPQFGLPGYPIANHRNSEWDGANSSGLLNINQAYGFNSTSCNQSWNQICALDNMGGGWVGPANDPGTMENYSCGAQTNSPTGEDFRSDHKRLGKTVHANFPYSKQQGMRRH